jgi:branched-subunit amino acid ABC-type transport system permease component
VVGGVFKMINKLWNILLVLIGASLSTAILIAFDILPVYNAIYGAICMLGGYLICMFVNSDKGEK